MTELYKGYEVKITPKEFYVLFEVLYAGTDESFLEGTVKWDGCSDWCDPVLHCCGRQGIMQVSEVMAFCYDWTAKNLEMFDQC